MLFVNSVIREFITAQANEDNEFITQLWLFKVKKKIVTVEIPHCLKNESSSKQFTKRFDEFTDNRFDVWIKWFTKKVKSLFIVKDKSLHHVCKIYKGVCLCGECYTGEIVRSAEVSWNEHNNPMKKSKPSKHVKDNVDHVFNWSVLTNAPKNMCQWKVLELYYIVLEKPTLNEQQLKPGRLNLFRNGVTCCIIK